MRCISLGEGRGQFKAELAAELSTILKTECAVRHRPIADELKISNHKLPTQIHALKIGAQVVGALALGALAIGALAIGALAIGRLVIGRSRI